MNNFETIHDPEDEIYMSDEEEETEMCDPILPENFILPSSFDLQGQKHKLLYFQNRNENFLMSDDVIRLNIQNVGHNFNIFKAICILVNAKERGAKLTTKQERFLQDNYNFLVTTAMNVSERKEMSNSWSTTFHSQETGSKKEYSSPESCHFCKIEHQDGKCKMNTVIGPSFPHNLFFDESLSGISAIIMGTEALQKIYTGVSSYRILNMGLFEPEKAIYKVGMDPERKYLAVAENGNLWKYLRRRGVIAKKLKAPLIIEFFQSSLFPEEPVDKHLFAFYCLVSHLKSIMNSPFVIVIPPPKLMGAPLQSQEEKNVLKEKHEEIFKSAKHLGELMQIPTATLNICESKIFEGKKTKIEGFEIQEQWVLKKHGWNDSKIYNYHGEPTFEFYLRTSHELNRIITTINTAKETAIKSVFE